jgi:thiamine pyrophosphate-dependent acetolactate synthase large subunit-like protein
VTMPGALRPALDKALAARGPFLLDVAIEGRA